MYQHSQTNFLSWAPVIARAVDIYPTALRLTWSQMQYMRKPPCTLDSAACRLRSAIRAYDARRWPCAINERAFERIPHLEVRKMHDHLLVGQPAVLHDMQKVPMPFRPPLEVPGDPADVSAGLMLLRNGHIGYLVVNGCPRAYIRDLAAKAQMEVFMEELEPRQFKVQL